MVYMYVYVCVISIFSKLEQEENLVTMQINFKHWDQPREKSKGVCGRSLLVIPLGNDTSH